MHQPASFKSPGSAARLLRSLQLDALVVVAYGLILPPAALAAPRLGCFNIHASLLPRWRGAAPIQRALLAGDATTGVTIMRMEEGLDTGPMLAARAIDIGAARHRRAALHDRLAVLGAELIVETLDALATGPRPRGAAARRRRHLCRENHQGRGADRLARGCGAGAGAGSAPSIPGRLPRRAWMARSCASGMPKLRDSTCAPAAAPGAAPGTVLAAADDGIDVACGRGVLRILRLQLAGRKPLGRGEFIQGQRLVRRELREPMNAAAASARSLAAHAVARILREGVTLDAALEGCACRGDPRARAVGALARATARCAATTGTRRSWAVCLSQPVRSLDFLVRALLSVALFELEDARTPEYAVVDAAVQTAKATDAARAGGTHQRGAAPLPARAQDAWMRTSRAIPPPVTPRRCGSPIACAPIGRCAGRSCWPRATPRRRCGCA